MHNLLARTSLALDRIECEIEPPGVSDQPDKELRISLVSSVIRGPRKRDKTGIDAMMADYGRLHQDVELRRAGEDLKILHYTEGFVASEERNNEWIEDRKAELREALKSKPHVICFPEFAVPMPLPSSDMLGYTDPSDYGRQFKEFCDMCAAAMKPPAKTRNQSLHYPFVFMGSFHCPQQHFNTGVIFPTGGHVEATNVRITRQKIDDEPVQEIKPMPFPVLHRKFFPARRAGETARVPSGMEFLTYKVGGLHIGVLICSDILDLNQFLNMARLGSLRVDRYPLDLILVPAYNLSLKLSTMCRELSLLASTSVAFVNANPCFEEFPSSKFFVCGFDIDELGKEMIDGSPIILEAPSAVPIECVRKGCSSELLTLRLDRANLKQLQNMFRGKAYEFFQDNRIQTVFSSDENGNP